MTSLSKTLITQLHAIKPNCHHKQVFNLKTNDLAIDLSRHYLSHTQLKHLSHWLEAQEFKDQIKRLFTDNLLNFTENRAVSHVLLRDDVHSCQQNLLLTALAKSQESFVKRFHAKEILGVTGLAITDILTIGIGGSHLGPDLVTDALQEFCQPDLKLHYLTGTDPYALKDTLTHLPALTTLVFVVSKSWSTVETQWNFSEVKTWFELQVGLVRYSDLAKQQFFAITANSVKAQADGFDLDHIFGMSDAIGGRFSLWSAVGLPMRLALGEFNFNELIAGAHAMDEHVKTQPIESNIPILLALLDLYYANSMNVQQRAVVPYTQRLRLLVNHLQQLEMESNGKSIDESGQSVDYRTGLAVWGGVGPNSQHSFHQWFYQGTFLVPIDFIALKGHALQPDFEQLLLSQCLAQAKVLWEGKDSINPHQRIKGGKPSTLILLNRLNPRSLGELIALYEHKVFAMGLLTNTNAFDQFGVEAGKTQGVMMLEAMQSTLEKLDPITQSILKELDTLC